MPYLIILTSLSTSFTVRKKPASFILLNWKAFVVYKFTFPSTFMIKDKTVPKFLLQPSFDIFMQDSFNIDISLNSKFRRKSTQLGNCWKLSIFNQSVSHKLYQCIEAFVVWIYFFVIDITVFSCYASLARPVVVKLFGSDSCNCETCQLCLHVLVQVFFRKWNQRWWSRISRAFN